MNKYTFQHGRFYKITYYGKINLAFINGNGREPIVSHGKGDTIWFVGLAWKGRRSNDAQTTFKLIASNWHAEAFVPGLYKKTHYTEVTLVHNEVPLYKKNRVKMIEPFTLKQFPTLIGTKTTTLHARFLANKISVKGFPNKEII